MRADEWMNPYGDRPASVYWVRRGVAALAVLILLIVIWPSGGHPKNKAPAVSSGAKTSASPSPSPAAVAAVTPCASTSVLVSADSAASDYPSGTNPKVMITIKNTSTSSCSVDTSKRYLTISSGNDTWWSSAACPAGAQPMVSVSPGQTITSSYVWTRIRQVTGCAANGNAPVGTYLAKAHLGDVETPGAVLRLH